MNDMARIGLIDVDGKKFPELKMNRGGARPGSGRKKVSADKKRVVLSCRVLPDTLTMIKDISVQEQLSIGALIDRMMQEMK